MSRVIMVLIVLSIIACSSDTTYLPALLDDPMASYEAEGLVLFDAWVYAQRPRFLGGAPVQAEVGRRYRIEDQSQVGQLLQEAVAYAESEGWTMRESLTGRSTLFVGAKELAPGSGKLMIALGPTDPIDDPDGPIGLAIYLDFDPVPTE
jgi:hypothetical protein